MRILLAILLSLSFGSGQFLTAADTIVVVVRHAEKATDDPKDPSLSDIGQARAAALAKALADYPITSAIVSEFKRAQQTAHPTLREHKITATTVPVNKDTAGDYGQRLAERVKREPQGAVILLVSHSNTVPTFISALTGIQIPPIVESSEFDRLYVITLPTQGKPRVISAKY
jgi:broad specificity phosphatase PhoE